MNQARRPDPDALLAAVDKRGRGRLKVFLGMAPGVGKTYEMLTAARARAAEGVEVLVGVVETHGRRETEALCEGLEVLARRPVEYNGRAYLEFDLDGALKRRPGLLLVDEYAHSNAPGSRHAKRWQDVEELLGAGIDVWTTLNVQHLESLVDVVWRITGVRQRETVPDVALSKADEIELIDVTPATLRERLAAGKVYVPETARLASERFFKAENLTALRELALRRAAQTIDDQLVAELRQRGLEGAWAAGERILVIIGADAAATALVRAGRRLSDLMMESRWTVAHVERPNRPTPPSRQAMVSEALALAETLGGVVVRLTGDDLVKTLLDYAAANHITQIVVGKPRGGGLLARLQPHLAQALLNGAEGVALHVVTDTERRDPADRPPAPAETRFAVLPMAAAVGASLIAAGIAAVVDRFSNDTDLALIFLLAVFGVGLRFGLWPSLLAAATSALAFDFLFLPPRYTFFISGASDVFTLSVFFVVALAAGWLTGRVRDQAEATSRRATALAGLLASSRRLSATRGAQAAAQALTEQMAAALSRRVAVLLPKDGDLVLAGGDAQAVRFSPADMAAARWAWDRGEVTGAGTDTMPKAEWTFHPLQGLKTRAGVAAIQPAPGVRGADPLVTGFLDQGAVAIERATLAADAADAEALRRSDRLRSALLNSISHDLRTPLSTVLGSASTLIEYGGELDAPTRKDLLESIQEEAERLNRYVGDLLDMTRLEGGALAPRSDPLDVRDVLAAAMARVERRMGQRRWERDFPAELSLVKADAGLLEQAIVNILENAITYSPDATPIEVSAYEDRRNVVISIEDEGRGIPTADLERVFEKFRRLEESTDRAKGAGLGLAIAKGFVEGMGGRIAAASPIHNGRGTRILISLAAAPPAPAP